MSVIDPAKYPIGQFECPPQINAVQRKEWIHEIARLPASLRALVTSLTSAQLDTPYRNGGWTARQLVHHVADSHMNSYVRFRWALTEDAPLIKAYEQDPWAMLPDARNAPVELSLTLLEGLHSRWVFLLEKMTDSDFNRTLKHPQLGELKLDWMLGLYAWHGRHHVAHIQSLKNQPTGQTKPSPKNLAGFS